ncbi:hypothetical protein HDE_06487 [Halotydeus destructor]|nr:hypothetical protein HDE_06487 [Halotydeus destructor]
MSSGKQLQHAKSQAAKSTQERTMAQVTHVADATHAWQLKFENSDSLVKQLMKQNAQLVESNIRLQSESKLLEESFGKMQFYEEQIRVLSVTNSSLFIKLKEMTKCQEALAKLKKENTDLIYDKQQAAKIITDLRQALATKEKSQPQDSELTDMRAKLESCQKVIENLKCQVRGYENCLNKLKLQLVSERDRYESRHTTQLVKITDLENSKIEETRFLSQQCHELELNVKRTLTVAGQLDEGCGVKNILQMKLHRLLKDVTTLAAPNDKFEKLLQPKIRIGSKKREKFCPICLVGHTELDSNSTKIMALTSCGHVLCSDCLENQSRIKHVCPMCQTSFKKNQMIKLYF